MSRRAITTATVVSTVMLVITVLLSLASYVISPWDHYLSLSDDFHVSVWGRGLDSRIIFYNDADYGPYSGSIIGFVDADGNVHPPLEREYAFGDSWGIYYRYFEWSDSTVWTLMVILWYPIAVFAILPSARLLRRIKGRNTSNVA
jgi:hypothetical protein